MKPVPKQNMKIIFVVIKHDKQLEKKAKEADNKVKGYLISLFIIFGSYLNLVIN